MPTLSVGDIEMVVRPLPSRSSLDAFVGLVGGIRGVDDVAVGGFDGEEYRLVAHLDRPTAFAGELRAVLHRHLSACFVEDGRLVVELAPACGLPPTRPLPPPFLPPRPPTRAPRAPAEKAPVVDAVRSAEDALLPLFADPATRAAAALVINDLDHFAILTFDREQRITAGAGGVHTHLGRGFELLHGQPASAVVRPQVWSVVAPGYEAAVTGTSATIDFVDSDGESVHEATFSPLLDGDHVIGGMVVSRDVTEARRSTRLLEELTGVLRVTFDHSPIGQAFLTPDGRWARVNETLRRMLGMSEADLLARRLHDVTHPADLAEETAFLDELLAGRREVYVLAKRFVHADGTDVPVLVTTTLLRGTDGAPHGLIAQVTPDSG